MFWCLVSFLKLPLSYQFCMFQIVTCSGFARCYLWPWLGKHSRARWRWGEKPLILRIRRISSGPRPYITWNMPGSQAPVRSTCLRGKSSLMAASRECQSGAGPGWIYKPGKIVYNCLSLSLHAGPWSDSGVTLEIGQLPTTDVKWHESKVRETISSLRNN